MTATARTKKDIYDAMQSLGTELTPSTSQGRHTLYYLGLRPGDFLDLTGARSSAPSTLRFVWAVLWRKNTIFQLMFAHAQRQPGSKDPNLHDFASREFGRVRCHQAFACIRRLMYDKLLVELTGSFKAPMGCRSFAKVGGTSTVRKSTLAV